MPSAPPIAPPDAPDPYAPLRRLLLALVVAGAGGLALELLLLEHYDSPWQWAPLALLALVLLVGGAAAVRVRPGRRLLRTFQGLMTLCAAAGVLGVYLHYRGNVEFERESDPTRSGLVLFWEAIRGATPALAPGALAQLGLLGLAVTFRHPALRSSPSDRRFHAVGHREPAR
jgi:hypothetical protein